MSYTGRYKTVWIIPDYGNSLTESQNSKILCLETMEAEMQLRAWLPIHPTIYILVLNCARNSKTCELKNKLNRVPILKGFNISIWRLKSQTYE